MRGKIKFFISCILGFSLSLIVSQCKPPVAPKESPIPVVSDTTVVIDTSVTLAAPSPIKIPAHPPLILVIKNLASANAPIIVGLYGKSNKFPDPKDQLKEYHFKPMGKEMVATITDLKFDTYAMAIYQDVNSNGKIDKNLIGIPTEPYAFSENYIPKVKAPNFNDCKFTYNAKSDTITMTMIK